MNRLPNYISEFSDHKQIPHLSIHNLGSTVSEFFELNVPYMLIYEAYNVKNHNCTFMAISPCDYIRTCFTKKEMPYLWTRSLHQHDFFEVMFILQGEVSQHIEQKSYHYTVGQCCVLNRNIRHREEFSTDFEAIFMNITDEFLNQLIDHDIQYSSDGTFHRYFGDVYHLIQQNQHSRDYTQKEYLDFIPIQPPGERKLILEDFYALFNQMIDETVHQRPGCVFIMEGLFSRFFSLLENTGLYHKSLVCISGGAQELLFNKISHILEAKHGRITREELETALNYNGDYLNRVVKKYTGMGLIEYGQIYCMKKAEDLLLHTDKNISQIVCELGFSNRSYFYRIFGEKYGMTPNEFRKRM